MVRSLQDDLARLIRTNAPFTSPYTLAERLRDGDETIGGGKRFSQVEFDVATRQAIVTIGDEVFLPDGIEMIVGDWNGVSPFW